MDDETEYAEVDDTQDEWEYDEPQNSPTRVQKTLMLIGELAVSILAGYLIGYVVGAVLTRFASES